jgi:hypothetical protein
MLSLIVGVGLTLGAFQDAQATPAFRGGAYVIAIELPIFEGRKWCKGSKPITGLTAKDFTVSLDKKPYPDAELVHDDSRPGHYMLSFTVPDAVRDGKVHRIDVKFAKGGGLWWQTEIPKPSADAEPRQVEDWISEACK